MLSGVPNHAFSLFRCDAVFSDVFHVPRVPSELDCHNFIIEESKGDGQQLNEVTSTSHPSFQTRAPRRNLVKCLPEAETRADDDAGGHFPRRVFAKSVGRSAPVAPIRGEVETGREFAASESGLDLKREAGHPCFLRMRRSGFGVRCPSLARGSFFPTFPVLCLLTLTAQTAM
jgi:hypothetical protein